MYNVVLAASLPLPQADDGLQRSLLCLYGVGYLLFPHQNVETYLPNRIQTLFDTPEAAFQEQFDLQPLPLLARWKCQDLIFWYQLVSIGTVDRAYYPLSVIDFTAQDSHSKTVFGRHLQSRKAKPLSLNSEDGQSGLFICRFLWDYGCLLKEGYTHPWGFQGVDFQPCRSQVRLLKVTGLFYLGGESKWLSQLSNCEFRCEMGLNIQILLVILSRQFYHLFI